MTAAKLAATVWAALPYVAFSVVVIGTLNFIWLSTETDPLNLIPSEARVLDGHYFFWSKTNGGYIEVSKSFWEWVRFHDSTVFLSAPFEMLAVVSLVFTYLSRMAAGQTSRAQSSERLRQVRASGSMLTSTRSAGLIGRVWFSQGLLRIQAYPGGIVVKPLFMAERVVLAREIIAVTLEGGLSVRSVPEERPIPGVGVTQVSPSFRLTGPFVQIDHAGIGMASPFAIWGSGNWHIAETIRSVAGTASVRSPVVGATNAQETTAATTRGETEAGALAETVEHHAPEPFPVVIILGFAGLSVIVAVWLVWSGITWAVPGLGLFGVLWTAAIILIFAASAWRIVNWIRR